MDGSLSPDRGPEAEVSRVAERLRERVRRGLAVPGQRLIEAEIVADTGAPRAKVREALRRLEQEGLVIIQPFRGASVRRLSRREIAETYAVREALEGLAAALAAQAPERSALAAHQDALDAAARDGDGPRFLAANGAWREALVELADNRVLKDQLARLDTQLHRLVFQSFYAAQVIAKARQSLARITAAVLSADAIKAEAAMRDHVREGFKVIGRMES